VENLEDVQQSPSLVAAHRRKPAEMRGFPPYPQSSRIPAWRRCGGPRIGCDDISTDFVGWRAEKARPKRKTRPGGQPDGSSHMGAWGGWALAPNTASMGRDYRSHTDWSRKGRRTFKRRCDFFNFWETGYFSRKSLLGGAIGVDSGRPVGRHGGGRRVQGPDCGCVLAVRCLFGGGFRSRGNRCRRRGDDG
jgi:hypothetical protein